METVKTEEKTYVRDISNMALLESDPKVKNDYLARKKMVAENAKLRELVYTLSNRLDQLEQKVDKVKE